ncbi:TetR family transcriptional regulator [Actinomadura macrotermitis]|uniref:HTH-type transcriptional repressor n=1 Tax=Actinomadura macrotermitis TaxID=2585200 RepID=A0A7K0C662_9ACTN|nr:TetR family transcriptional regulator [Actinomadura macrotermitis]MQY08940.1 HTH-type transcriptional repressor [Actinomadura macrotermitis]
MAYDSTATKERILAAATAEFAAHGVAGARVDRVAAQAKANKRAIYDYFGDKNALFAAVLEHLMAELAEAVPPGEEDLPAYAERLFDYHRAHPEALRLLLWEALELGDRPVPAEQARTQHYQDKIRAAGGEDDAARNRLFLVLGMVGWSLAMPQLRRMILGPGHDLDELRHVIAGATRALSREPEV